MDVSYRNNLLALGALSWFLLVSQPTRKSELEAKGKKAKKENAAGVSTTVAGHQDKKHPQSKVYQVYFLIMLSVWLQEIYVNTLYRDYEYSSKLRFYLKITEYAVSGIYSVIGGGLADRRGRKSLCVFATSCYGASACLIMIPNLPLQFLSRALAAIGLSAILSTLEAWIATDFFARKLVQRGCDLYRTFGTMGVINAFSAVACGVLGDRLIAATGSKNAPLILSWLLMWQAMQQVWSAFKEVYGAVSTDDIQLKNSTPALSAYFQRPYIYAFTLASTVFEGSALLFATNAMSILEHVHKTDKVLPYTYIFASIVASALTGALTFNIVMQKRVIRHSQLMMFVLAASTFATFKLGHPKTERETFRVLCLFGFCSGLYFPCMSTMKSRMIEEGVRSTVFSAMRAPAYLFAVVALLLNEGATHPGKVFGPVPAWFTAAFAGFLIVSLNKRIP
ncbi:hypothetical protein BX600DRAFT_461456 [Xylariales sp. PMI_506]|nr:hypothetical protein BX600DRAFT_461456 [Xylariales sp. PMI_506]